jgi:hypothetical protein
MSRAVANPGRLTGPTGRPIAKGRRLPGLNLVSA